MRKINLFLTFLELKKEEPYCLVIIIVEGFVAYARGGMQERGGTHFYNNTLPSQISLSCSEDITTLTQSPRGLSTAYETASPTPVHWN